MSEAQTFFDAGDATWPAARCFEHGPWILREGQGGGKRVSAATARGAITGADIPTAEAAMREMDQRPLFMVRAGKMTSTRCWPLGVTTWSTRSPC